MSYALSSNGQGWRSVDGPADLLPGETLHETEPAIVPLPPTKEQGITKAAQILAGYMLIRGYIFDFIVNMVWMTILLREWPRELIVTARLNRHAATGSGLQFERCAWVQNEFCKWYDTKHADGIHR